MRALLIVVAVGLMAVNSFADGSLERRLFNLEQKVKAQASEIAKLKMNDHEYHYIPFDDVYFDTPIAKPIEITKVGNTYFIEVSSVCRREFDACWGDSRHQTMFLETSDFRMYQYSRFNRELIKKFQEAK